MRRRVVVSFLVALVVSAVSASAQPRALKDVAGAKDPALFTRMANFFLSSSDAFVEKQFDSYTFLVKGEKASERKPVEGHLLVYKYTLDKSRQAAAPSSLQIMRNYQAAAEALGGKVMLQDHYRTTIMIPKAGGETWVEVAPVPAGYAYTLRIVERQAMQQEVKADAAVLRTGLTANGHVEVPGIFFDTAKADIKPESDASLREMVKLLQAEPALKVWVVGHTDNTGADDMNVSLSQARAASVVKALSGMGIAPARLAAHGAGPYAPVAENRTEAGRAKNRRVELVARQ